ncbi:type IV pilin protein [Aquipseudomonas alcaligenes]|uniref:Type IV pilin protein n=1 Tax=Aquipseudomonas alcaligenes TaxID=43263 RepID=A0AA42N251_AQUAC|nr:type IV pilin protein [Pseudomonas alcaligenes]MDH1056051.1 type IV pilin protein [Pseudomonas alcaligenes]
MKRNGFTLIELMIAVAVVGILAALAYPSYTEYVKKTYRAEVVAVMLENAQIMERYYSQNGTYENASIVDQSPPDGNAIYDIEIDDASTTDSAFVINAKAVDGGLMDGDECEALSINELGEQGSGDGDNSVCWRR